MQPGPKGSDTGGSATPLPEVTFLGLGAMTICHGKCPKSKGKRCVFSGNLNCSLFTFCRPAMLFLSSAVKLTSQCTGSLDVRRGLGVSGAPALWVLGSKGLIWPGDCARGFALAFEGLFGAAFWDHTLDRLILSDDSLITLCCFEPACDANTLGCVGDLFSRFASHRRLLLVEPGCRGAKRAPARGQ